MNKKGPIVVVEDDLDDQMILSEVFKSLNYLNEIVFFEDGEQALNYLQKDGVYPFLILSDINLPKLDGFRLRQMVYTNDQLSKKCIPYLFFSTTASQKVVADAYTMSIQGFFIKPTKFDDMKDTIRIIIEYWQKCFSPNNYKEHYHQWNAASNKEQL